MAGADGFLEQLEMAGNLSLSLHVVCLHGLVWVSSPHGGLEATGLSS